MLSGEGCIYHEQWLSGATVWSSNSEEWISGSREGAGLLYMT